MVAETEVLFSFVFWNKVPARNRPNRRNRTNCSYADLQRANYHLHSCELGSVHSPYLLNPFVPNQRLFLLHLHLLHLVSGEFLPGSAYEKSQHLLRSRLLPGNTRSFCAPSSVSSLTFCHSRSTPQLFVPAARQIFASAECSGGEETRCGTCQPHRTHMVCASQDRPRSPFEIPTISTTSPEECLGLPLWPLAMISICVRFLLLA